MKKIIFINRYFFPDISATSQMLSGIAFNLKLSDYKIHVISNRFPYGGGESLKKTELHSGVKIHRIWTSHFGRGNLFGRLIDYLSFYFSALFYLLFLAKKNDVIIAKTDPPLISVISMFVCKIKGCQLINWLQDLFPEVAFELGVKMPGSLYRFLLWLRNKSLKFALCNVVIGYLMRDKLIELGVDKENIHVIQNWADSEIVYPVERSNNKFEEKWGLKDKFLITYSGNMGRSHDFSTIIKLAKELKEDSDIVFLCIGSGAQKNELEKTASQDDLNFIFKPYQDMNDISDSLSLADIHIVSLKPELEGLIVPSKYYGILAVGKPILFIGDSNGELGREILSEQIGYCTDGKDPQRLASLMTHNKKEMNELKIKGQNAVYLFKKKYDLKISVSKWKNVLNNNT